MNSINFALNARNDTYVSFFAVVDYLYFIWIVDIFIQYQYFAVGWRIYACGAVTGVEGRIAVTDYTGVGDPCGAGCAGLTVGVAGGAAGKP